MLRLLPFECRCRVLDVTSSPTKPWGFCCQAQVLPQLPSNARYKFHANECAWPCGCKPSAACMLQIASLDGRLFTLLAVIACKTFHDHQSTVRRRCFDWGTIGWVLEQVPQFQVAPHLQYRPCWRSRRLP